MVLDRARYNFSEAAKQQCRQLRIFPSAARPRGPTEKSGIEHYNHIIKSDFSPMLPGWRGTKGDREAIDQGMSAAVLTIQEYEKLYRMWVCGQYLNKPGQDGLTPKQRWQSHYKNHLPAIRYSAEQLSLFRLMPTQLTFRASGGLKRLEIRYASDELAALSRRLGNTAEVTCYVNRQKMEYILVQDPYSKTLLRVESTEDPKCVKGLTEYQQQMILAKCREMKRKNPSIIDQMEARRCLMEQVNKYRVSQKLRKRSFSRKMQSMPVPDVQPQENAAPKAYESSERLVTELESQMLDLEEWFSEYRDEK